MAANTGDRRRRRPSRACRPVQTDSDQLARSALIGRMHGGIPVGRSDSRRIIRTVRAYGDTKLEVEIKGVSRSVNSANQ